MKLIRALLMLLVCKLTIAIGMADVSYSSGQVLPIPDFAPTPEITIHGRVTKSDVEQFRQLSLIAIRTPKTSGFPYFVNLDSSGGDVYASMDIGRMIRRHRASVAVQKESKCLSSCVFILAAGVQRI